VQRVSPYGGAEGGRDPTGTRLLAESRVGKKSRAGKKWFSGKSLKSSRNQGGGKEGVKKEGGWGGGLGDEIFNAA